MKRGLLSISALAMMNIAAFAADMPVKARPVAAPPQLSGYVELYGGGAWTKASSTFCDPTCFGFEDRADGWVLGGAARATYWWMPGASLQLDVQGEGTSYKFSSGPLFVRSSSHDYLVGAHANWRDPQRGLLGVFGGAGDSTIDGLSVRHGVVGVEAQAYWNMLTLYGQAGYNSSLGSISSFVDQIHAWFVRGTARFYVNPNFRLEATGLYADGRFEPGSVAANSADLELWLWRAKAEHRFATAPFSVFLAYEGSRATVTGNGSGFNSSARLNDNRVTAGIRLFLGEGTLQGGDTRGTTLDIIAPFSVPALKFSPFAASVN